MKHRENAMQLIQTLEVRGVDCASLKSEDIDLFSIALCHSSYANEMTQAGVSVSSNERLEFLGDAVLDLVIADHLYNRYELSEGKMSMVKAAVVSEPVLAGLAKELGLKELICLGKGEELTGGREKNSILADSFEAFVGAFYLIFGLEKTRDFLTFLFERVIHTFVTSDVVVDYKTSLQELTQARFKTLPEYRLVAIEGPSHARKFTVEVWLQGVKIANASGRSKKEAQQKAAKIAYEILREKEEFQGADNTR